MRKESEPHHSRLCEEVGSLRQKVDLFTAELDNFQSSLSRLNDLMDSIEQEISDMK